MPQTIAPLSLLREAEAIQAELDALGDIGALSARLSQLGTKFQEVASSGGLTLIEPDYHRAAKIFNSLAFESVLRLYTDCRYIPFNHNLSQ